MKYIFLVIGIVLSLLAYLTPLITGTSDDGVRKMYWVTDPNPARGLQTEVFQDWLSKNKGKEVNLSVDSANSGDQKVIIQGVTGVAGDVIDYWGIDKLRHFTSIGFMKDVSEESSTRGFGLDDTYENLKPLLFTDGVQRGYPANVISYALLMNKEVFKKAGVPLLSENPTWDEFETKGRMYVKNANRGLERQRYFFSPPPLWFEMARTFGADMYNETLTGTAVDRLGWTESLEKLNYLIYDLNILPNPSQAVSFSTDDGYGGGALQLFHAGHYATIREGRYALIQLRQMSEIDIGAVHIPYSKFQTGMIGTRAVFVYEGSENHDLGLDFLEFLASEDYNKLIVHDADGNPPNPQYLESEDYLNPPDYPNEWGIHAVFKDSSYKGIPESLSPYHRPSDKGRIWYDTFDRWQAGLIDTPEFQVEVKDSFDFYKEQYLKNADSELKKDYKYWSEVQLKVDQALSRGDRLKKEWIRNPFYLAYYQHLGLIIE